MKYFILVGEASGDLHGANLLRALMDNDPNAQFEYWGGDQMARVSGQPLKHIRDLAFMGFWEVISNLSTIRKNFKLCKQQITAYQPDAVIFIDYPGFNLRMAKWCKDRNFNCYYYISPQVWAWKANRVKTIAATIEEMYVILPFEQEFYAERGVDVSYVGHPLVPVIEQFEGSPDFRSRYELDERPIISILPGSRTQEISKMLPIMGQMAKSYKQYQWCIAGAPNKDSESYAEILNHARLKPDLFTLVENETYDLLSHSHAALVTSGTATLETALFGIPEVVCYKGNTISFQIAKRLVKVPFISLVNLIVRKEIVVELIQGSFNVKTLKQSLDTLLEPQEYERIKADLTALKELLTEDLNPPQLVAKDIVKRLTA